MAEKFPIFSSLKNGFSGKKNLQRKRIFWFSAYDSGSLNVIKNAIKLKGINCVKLAEILKNLKIKLK